jgi:integrase
MRFHDLRHTVSTWLAVRYPQAIKDAILGHAPRGVSGLYTHVQFEDLKKAIEAMPRLLASAGTEPSQAVTRLS